MVFLFLFFSLLRRHSCLDSQVGAPHAFEVVNVGGTGLKLSDKSVTRKTQRIILVVPIRGDSIWRRPPREDGIRLLSRFRSLLSMKRLLRRACDGRDRKTTRVCCCLINMDVHASRSQHSAGILQEDELTHKKRTACQVIMRLVLSHLISSRLVSSRLVSSYTCFDFAFAQSYRRKNALFSR